MNIKAIVNKTRLILFCGNSFEYLPSCMVPVKNIKLHIGRIIRSLGVGRERWFQKTLTPKCVGSNPRDL